MQEARGRAGGEHINHTCREHTCGCPMDPPARHAQQTHRSAKHTDFPARGRGPPTNVQTLHPNMYCKSHSRNPTQSPAQARWPIRTPASPCSASTVASEMAAAPHTMARYKVTPPAPTGPGIKPLAKALSEDGPLEVDPAHLVAILLPDAVSYTHLTLPRRG